MKMLYFLLLCLGCCLFQACGSDHEAPPPPEVVGRTVLVYMAADNNLIGFAHDDFDEMKQGMQQVQGEDVHFLVYRDLGFKAELVELKNRQNTVEEVVLKQYGTPRNSVGVAETSEVLQDAFRLCPATSYGLVYWSHGDGWIPQNTETRWIGQDARNGFMDIAQLVQVLQKAPVFDFLLYDACFMQSIEVSYELRAFSRCFIGSPTETPGPGAPYQAIVPAMFTSQPGVQISKAYFDYYQKLYVDPDTPAGQHLYRPWGDKNQWASGVSMAAVSSASLEELAQATRQALSKVQRPVDWSALRTSVLNYNKRNSFSNCDYFDWVQLMEQLLTPADFAAWKAVFQQSLLYWATTSYNYSSYADMFSMQGAQGVSHFIPYSMNHSFLPVYRQTAWYRDAGLDQLGW